MKSNTTMNATRCLISAAAAALLFFGLAGPGLTEEPAPEEKKAEKPEVQEKVRTGVIASSGSYGQSTGLNIDTDGAAPGDEANIISASVNRLGREECEVSLKNGSDTNTYSVSFRVVGRGETGAKQLDRSYTASIKPKQTVQRTVTCRDSNMEVVLQSARKQGK